ncbi:MAG: ferrochelatase [Deltaproteobacteria bacterium]|nr:ferrochelatase [Deltaproteobacteria bacterium]
MIAVFLLDFGGPETLDDVQPFLENLFSDRSIFPFPFGQEIFAKVISKLRAPKLARQYALIGGGSPLPKQSRDIAAQLQTAFTTANLDIKVFVGMRYFTPTIDATLAQIAATNPKGMVVIPMFPHYSTATTLSVFEEFNKAYDRQKLKIPFQLVEWWHDHPQFIAAWCYSITRALDSFDETIRKQIPILFTAHGLPLSFITERKDPYPKQIKTCCETITTYLGGEHPAYISYQSRVGVQEWLKPATINFVKELGERGIKNLVVVPISFITDHIETLFEIDHEIIPVAKKAGIEKIIRCEALYYTPYLKKTLEDLVLRRLPALL